MARTCELGNPIPTTCALRNARLYYRQYYDEDIVTASSPGLAYEEITNKINDNPRVDVFSTLIEKRRNKFLTDNS